MRLHNVNYEWSATLRDCTWAEIQQIAKSGVADKVFSIGNKKSTTVMFFDGSTLSGTFSGQKSKTNMDVILVGFNIHGSNSISFITAGYPMYVTSEMDSQEFVDGWPKYNGYDKHTLREVIDANAQEILPETYPYVKSVTIRFQICSSFDPDKYKSRTSFRSLKEKIFAPSAYNVGINTGYLSQETYKYPYFTSNSRRDLDGTNKEWLTTSVDVWSISTDGDSDYDVEKAGLIVGPNEYGNGFPVNEDCLEIKSKKFYFPLCFTIG